MLNFLVSFLSYTPNTALYAVAKESAFLINPWILQGLEQIAKKK